MATSIFADEQASNEAQDEYVLENYNKVQNSIASIEASAEKSVRSSTLGKVSALSPLLSWSADIVNVLTSQSQDYGVQLRVRDINTMHKNARKQETVASLKLVKESITDITNPDEAFRRRAGSVEQDNNNAVLFETTNFILQAIGEGDTEKYQIIESFGTPQIFMFGRRYRMYSYSGMLWNNECNNWKDEFKYLYNKYLRGTACVENGVKALLTYDRSVRLGYVVSMTINYTAEVEMAVPVSFSMYIEDEKELIDNEALEGATDFQLIREQSASAQAVMSQREKAINTKLEINLPKEAARIEPIKPKSTSTSSNPSAPVNLKTVPSPIKTSSGIKTPAELSREMLDLSPRIDKKEEVAKRILALTRVEESEENIADVINEIKMYCNDIGAKGARGAKAANYAIRYNINCNDLS